MFKPTVSSGVPGSTDGSGGAPAPYLDYIANDLGASEPGCPTVGGRALDELQREGMQASAERWLREWAADQTRSCRKWATVGECEDGHRASRTLLCGREWCDECGLVNSDAHKRRFARWLPKLQQLRRLCQLVVTFPLEVRAELRDRERLTAVASACTAELKRLGVQRGVRRWHWFGDEKPGKAMVWHPHLNFLMDCGYFGRLDEFKQFLTELVGRPCVVHVEFATEPKQMVHMATYVTRATFRKLEWDPEMGPLLHGFRNSGQWGKWKDEPVWSFDELEREGDTAMKPSAIAALERNECPCCGKPIRWTKVIRSDELVGQVVEDYGGGYARLADVDMKRARKDAEWGAFVDELRRAGRSRRGKSAAAAAELRMRPGGDDAGG